MRDPETGKGGSVPADMTYREWKEIYVDKTSTFEEWKAKRVDNSGEGGIISKKISDHVVEYYVESGATFDFTALEQELLSSFVGRETEKYIEEHGLRVESITIMTPMVLQGRLRKITFRYMLFITKTKKNLHQPSFMRLRMKDSIGVERRKRKKTVTSWNLCTKIMGMFQLQKYKT